MIPLIRVHGTHAEAGATIGAATRDAIHKHTDALEYDLDLVLRYRGSAIKYLPWVVEELEAAAAAAQVDPLRLFAASVEELHASPVREAATTGCTDIAATPHHSADGHPSSATTTTSPRARSTTSSPSSGGSRTSRRSSPSASGPGSAWAGTTPASP